MQINSTYINTQQAISRGLNGVQQTAASIARPDQSAKDRLEDLVELKQQENQIKANVQAMKTMLDVEDRLLDVMA